MTRIGTFSDALAAIWARSSYDRGFVSNPFAGDEAARLGLRRTEALLRHLDHPERSFPVVHVAGSKGKGSTCMVVDSILRAAGMRTGRFLSPPLHSYRERFVVDDELIAEADFTALTADAIDAAEHVERTVPDAGEITAFELSTAMAFQWFSQSGCEVAVIEVGLGGTLDATNVVDPAVSIITALDFEHTAILGTTMGEIAGNKAGIIKPGRPVVSAAQPAEGMAVIEARAAEYGAPLYVAGRDWTVGGSDRDFTLDARWGTLAHLRSALVGQHQVENAALAIAAVEVLGEIHDVFSGIDERAIRQGVAMARHPGRFEQIALPSGQTVVIDGAHSPASATALATTVEDRFPGASVAIVIGMFADKEPTHILDPLRRCADHWIAVAPDDSRALPVDVLRSAVEALGVRCVVASGVAEGIQEATALGCEVVLVTGSLTTAAEARTALGLAPPPDDLH